MSAMNTQEAATYLGSDESKTLNGELVGYDGSGNEVFVLQLKGFSLRNRIGSTGDPTEIPNDYLTAAQMRALVAAGVVFQFSADGTNWHDTQAGTDQYFRVRSASDSSASWSSAVALPSGEDGASAYDIWKAQEGNSGKTVAQFLESLKGADGSGVSSVSATTLSPGSSATASLSNGVLNLGIPTGANGASNYLTIAYASNSSGSDFSLTQSNTRKYVGFLVTTSPVTTPTASMFSGKWVKFIGEDGDNAFTVDDALSTTSENAVQNKVVKAALDALTASVASNTTAIATKQNTLSFDTAPTANSNNPVTSTGIKAALDLKQDSLPAGVLNKYLKYGPNGLEWNTPAGGGESSASVDLSNYYTKPQADTLLASKLSAPSGGSTGQFLKKTANGAVWSDVTATDYHPLYDRRVVSPVEITDIESTLRSLIEDMPHMCPKTIVVTHDCGDDEPTPPASATDFATGFQLGHVYQLTLWGGLGNYDGYGHATPNGTPGPSSGYGTRTALTLSSDYGAAAGTYYLTNGVWTRPASGNVPAYYIGNSGWTAWAFAGWYAGPDTDVAAAYQEDTDCIIDGPYYCVVNYFWAPNKDGDAEMASALDGFVEQHSTTERYPLSPEDAGLDPEDEHVIIGVVYWATWLDITPCVVGTCPFVDPTDSIASMQSRIAALEALAMGTLTVSHTGTAPSGAKWSVDSGTTWRDFGTSATLAPGSYTVTFKSVTGYTAPSSQSVTLTAGGTQSVSVAYTAVATTGTVTLTFSGTVPTGAGWTINGQSYTSGDTATLSPGTYAITYASVEGYGSPSTPTSVTVAAGDTLTLSAEYTEQQSSGPSYIVSFTLSTSASGLAGTWTLVEGVTTEYNGNTYPVYQNGSQYLAMRSSGKPHINSSADVSQTSLWRPKSYTAGAEMTASSLTGEWNNPNDDWDDDFTFTEVAS
ncbi:MAG: hypothetical protein J5654_09635 [Victivallales bacterium]|nr:hypothetical protein [Victivallales bacterium]